MTVLYISSRMEGEGLPIRFGSTLTRQVMSERKDVKGVDWHS